MSLINLIHGGGRRRRSDENWLELERRASDAESRAKHVDGAFRYECPQRIHPAFWVYSPHRIPCPWCEIGGLKQALKLAAEQNVTLGQQYRLAEADRKRFEELLGADAGLPAAEPVPAPIEQGCRDTPASNADTQAVDVADLRAAMGEGDTQLLPVVPVVAIPPLDQLPAVTWGTSACGEEALEKWATATSPRDAGPTEVSAVTGHLASHRVQLATTSTD